MQDRFCHLHLHSSYSFTDGFGLPEQYISRAVELEQPGIGVTDHGNISVHFKWYNKCNKAGIKPILGCEFYIVANTDEVKIREYDHITVLVKNNIGYTNLTKLVTKSYCEQYYYKPRITYQDLFDHQEGLIVLSGCLSSPIMKLLKDNNIKGAENLIELFDKNIDNFYIEVQPISFLEGVEAYRRLIKLYNEKLKPKGMKWVATNDCHYVNKEHAKVQEILLCVQSRDLISNPNHWKFNQDDFYLKSRKEMEDSLNSIFNSEYIKLEEKSKLVTSCSIDLSRNMCDTHRIELRKGKCLLGKTTKKITVIEHKTKDPFVDFTAALDFSLEIMNSVDFTFPTALPISYPMPNEEKVSYLHKICEEGLKQRVLKDNTAGIEEKVYRERLDYELDLIIKKNFVDYFLVITDLVQWAKKVGILVGPARGSAAGSLACYALAITEVEPIRYSLIFERFIDLNREDLPDIDIDFEDVRRHEVKEYLEQKYGRDKVGNLPVFAAFKGKSALDDVGRVFGIPFGVVDKVKNAIVERSGGDSRASFTLEDTFTSDVFEYPKEAIKLYPEFKYAIELEGQLRQIGQHAAGVVISNEPITNFCALYKIKDSYVISMDYKDASTTGLLKIDLLGLNTLSVISRTLRLISERHRKVIDIYNLPLDDPKVYQGFCDGKLFGIFQFDGQAVNQVCRQIMPRDFDSLSAISALARPGPLNSGSTTMFIRRRAGLDKVEYSHPVMEQFTKNTYGIVVYQEQVMKTMREVGKMSWKDTSEIRKLISRSQGVEKFNTFKDKFIIGAKENGMDDNQIDKIWDSICTFGSWAFNASHSVSYTIISYWTMWLKVHYPLEFYSSIMALTETEDKKSKILKEYKKDGNKVLPIDINKSKKQFSIDEAGLRIGFADIKGIGAKAAESIVKHQPYNSYTNFCIANKGARVTETAKRNLINLGAFDALGNDAIQYTLFGEEVKEYEKEEMTFSEKFKLCPWDMEFGLDKNWLPIIKSHINYFGQEPTPIEYLTEMENAKDVIIYGIVYDKNLRDAREVSLSKGKNFDTSKYNIVHLLNKDIIKYFHGNEWTSKYMLERYKQNYDNIKEGIDYVFEYQFQFANFVVEDDSDFVTVRLSHIAFPQYGKLIFEGINPEDPVVIKGKMGSGIRMFFANKILSLKQYEAEQAKK